MNKKEKLLNKVKTKYSELVRTSRAGDIFHYRWAARFCLKMIKPKSPIISVTIEQSKDSEKPGECVMDMAVYSAVKEEDFVDYYQMKHSEVRMDKHMTLGELRKTIEGYSERFKSHKNDETQKKVKYYVVTNRRIDLKLLEVITQIAKVEKANKRIKDQLTRYTKLNDEDLRDFCKNLVVQGCEGNYEDQFYNLIGDTGRLISGVDSTDIVNKLFTMIQARALPNDRSEITRATVLNQFGCSSEKILYPAPSNFEKLENPVIRDEYIRLSEAIIESNYTKIITATGGLGKSIFTGMLPDLLGEDYLTVIYDCFGNGSYRNSSKFRHRHKDALVQMANELADQGYCEPLLPVNPDPDLVSEAFQVRISNAITRFKKLHKNGRLVIAVDAADNAEMAAEINEHLAFAGDLVQQGLPDDCILVMLCRPERKHLLTPPRDIVELEMTPFTVEETEAYLLKHVSRVSHHNAEEVHRLTNGNPRVVSIAIQESTNIHDVLRRLGPKPTTVEKQVEILLNQAVDRIRDQLPDSFLDEMNALCCGLAMLPPDIPIQDLSAVTGVDEATIKSFVSEMGAQIIVAEEHLHFRDEPTEHWFRETYFRNEEVLNEFIDRIEPLTAESIYLAAALPELYVLAGHFDKMIEVVLDGHYLPKMSELDIREVEYTRLKYAVRSAINADRHKDLISLGLMAGDKGEIHNRIYRLYQKHFDILHMFMSKEPMRELAFKGKLRGDWLGSDRLYTAVLLSETENGQPETRIYYRNACEFLYAFLDERKRSEEQFYQERLSDDDLFALVLTVYNISGLDEATEAIFRWSPEWIVFELSRKLSSYLIDISEIDEVYSFLNKTANNIYCVLAIGLELNKIGRSYDKSVLENAISNFKPSNIVLPSNSMFSDKDAAPVLSVITFCEKMLMAGLKEHCQKFMSVLFPRINPSAFVSDYKNYERSIALRAHAIRIQLQPNEDFFDHEYFKEGNKQGRLNQDRDKVKGIFEALYPWYKLRLDILLGKGEAVVEKSLKCRTSKNLSYEGQYGRFNSLEKERYTVVADIFLQHQWNDESEAAQYYSQVLDKEKYGLPRDRVNVLRGLMRTCKYGSIVHSYEIDVYETIKNSFDEPNEKVEILMLMVRSLLGYNRYDARSYFEEAVKENERFGDDLPSKWRAVASIAKRASDGFNSEHELAYRFIRVAEFVGEHVDREKYWNRNGAVTITALLSPSQGLAAISRWRERDVGWLEEQLPYVFEALIDKDLMSSAQTWGLTGFFPNNEEKVVELAVNAIQKEEKAILKCEIARQLNRIAGIKGYSRRNCERLKEVVCELPSFNEPTYPGREATVHISSLSSSKEYINGNKIEQLLNNWHYDDLESVKKVFGYVNSVNGLYSSNDYYWQCLAEKVPIQKYSDFLMDILNIPKVDFWSISRIMTNIPKVWKERRGYGSFWDGYLKKVGEVYASDLLSAYYRRPLEERCQWPENYWHQLYIGCMESFKNIHRDFGSSEYYDLVAVAAMIESAEASRISLDTALKMLEKDIDEDFGDGPPENLPDVSDDFNETYAAYYKAALASPDCEVRWQAVHGLVRYGLTTDASQLEETISNMNKADAKAFLGKGFKLYDLSYHLYLLIALQRISLDQPQKLLGLKRVLMSYFDGRFSHGLIQLAAYNTIQLLAEQREDIFSELDMKAVERSFVSPNAVVHIESYYRMERLNKFEYLMESPDTYHVAYDFDSYWLNSLERIFNIPVKHLVKIIGNYITDTMGVTFDENGWVQDKRKFVFRGRKYERRTYTSHGSHPSAENLSFYLSYHGMFIIAGKLLKKEILFVSDDIDESDNPYLAWLTGKYLSRGGGDLLMDGRTPMPVRLPLWAKLDIDGTWLTETKEQYLKDCMFVNGDVCVDGYWEYQENGFRETVMVASVLVKRETVSSLLMTLSDLPPHDYYLGNNDHFHDEENEPFWMEEWIVQREVFSGLDKHDPWAKGTGYPDYEIDERYLDRLNLRANKSRTKWMNADDGTLAASYENWVEEYRWHNETDYRSCQRFIAKEELLIRLCNLSKKALVINVKIDRERIKDEYSTFEGSEKHSYHAFKVIDAEGWWVDEE